MTEPKEADAPRQLSLPGLPGRCPHCGSGKVDLDALHEDQESLEADRWRCRACDRVWWQLGRP